MNEIKAPMMAKHCVRNYGRGMFSCRFDDEWIELTCTEHRINGIVYKSRSNQNSVVTVDGYKADVKCEYELADRLVISNTAPNLDGIPGS